MMKHVFAQRCFYLFLALGLLIAAAPIVAEYRDGMIVGSVINLVILVTATVAVARLHVGVVLATILVAAIVVVQILEFALGRDQLVPVRWALNAMFYLLTMYHLLRYVLLPSILDMDKLYGAAAIYLMMGVLWAYIYALIEYFLPGAFGSINHSRSDWSMSLLYFSFSVLTTVGFGDIVPVLAPARSATILQQVTGVLYVAILIARLTSAYQSEDKSC